MLAYARVSEIIQHTQNIKCNRAYQQEKDKNHMIFSIGAEKPSTKFNIIS
jgi:hypothetical protein